MEQYYYLITSLKDLSVDQDKIPFEVSSFIEDVLFEVDGHDLELFNVLRLHFDNLNLVNLLKKEEAPFIPNGLFSETKLSEEISHPGNLPTHMVDFIQMVKDDEREFPNLSLEDELSTHYFRYLKTFNNDFFQRYVDFDFNLKNTLSALNLKSKKLNAEGKILLLSELSQNLIQSNQEGFGLVHEIEWLQDVLDIFQGGNLVEKERRLLQIRFDFIERMLEFEEFTINRVLGYFVKLQLLERWTSLKEEGGLKVIEETTEKLADESKIFTGTY